MPAKPRGLGVVSPLRKLYHLRRVGRAEITCLGAKSARYEFPKP